jgi:septum formation protein
MAVTLVLASQSPARLALLRAAGIEPVVVVSDVDEEAVLASLGPVGVEEAVVALAQAKARAVVDRVQDSLVLACDSLFTMDGEVWGKPSGPVEARDRIRSMRSREGQLVTGHHLVHPDGRERSATAATIVRFGPMTDREVDAYVATGEPLSVAGSFTLDGRSAPFVDGVVGDHTNVIGLSLPLLRRLLGELDTSVVDLWGDGAARPT